MKFMVESENITRLSLPEKEVILVGTAHISRESVDLVKHVIETEKPSTVCVELCDQRFSSLKDPEKWKKTDIVKLFKEGKANLLLVQLILASYQKKLGDKLKIKPGEEMLTAIDEAEKLSATLVLADRDIKTTLKRVWGSVGFFSTFKLLLSAIGSIFSPMDISEEEIENLKKGDALSQAMDEFSRYLPEVRIALIDERDTYLAGKIQTAPGQKVVAVVGAGHVPGIKNKIFTPIDLAPLEEQPKASLLSKILTWGIPGALVLFLIYSSITIGLSQGAKMLESWALITGSAAAFGALISLAHPLSILAAFVSAPLATIHPLIATGWVSGLVEASLKRPTVADFETVVDDFTSIKGFFSNRILRVLLVMMLTNIGAMLGMFYGVKVILSGS